MNLSKSRYCNGLKCVKLLWLNINKSDVRKDTGTASLENGNKVGELAKSLLGEYINIDFNSNVQVMIDETKKVIEENDNVIITEASFGYNGNFCSVDLLKKNGSEYEIYEVKSSTGIVDEYYDDISYQYYVLNKCGLNVKKCHLVHLNSSYIRNGEIDLNKLFTIEDLTSDVLDKQKNIEENISKINDEFNAIDLNKFEPCAGCNKCPYFDYCSRDIVKPNVFDVIGLRFDKKIKLFNDDIISFEDLKKYDKLSKKQLEQVKYELSEYKTKIDYDGVKSFLDTVRYPLYFLDFETYHDPIPPFDNSWSYEQITFQYSLHYILEKGGEVLHKEFLGDGVNDPRRSLAEQLVNGIPVGCCVVAYNKSFEETRIKEMASIYPDLSEHLLNIKSNIIDLEIPFDKRYYYNKDMKGKSSIKYVLPALFPNNPDYDYHNLDMVHKGDEASYYYSILHTFEGEEREKLIYNMFKYCGLDTYSMVVILKKLEEECESKRLKK